MNSVFRSFLRQGIKYGSTISIAATSSPVTKQPSISSLFLLSKIREYCTEKKIDNDEIEKIVKNNKVVVFMKGNPEAPRCGFSNAVVQILRMHGVQYDSYDVLQSEELRQGKKENQ